MRNALVSLDLKTFRVKISLLFFTCPTDSFVVDSTLDNLINETKALNMLKALVIL